MTDSTVNRALSELSRGTLLHFENPLPNCFITPNGNTVATLRMRGPACYDCTDSDSENVGTDKAAETESLNGVALTGLTPKFPPGSRWLRGGSPFPFECGCGRDRVHDMDHSGTGEPGIDETGACQHRTCQVGVPQVGPPEVTVLQNGLLQDGAIEICETRVHLGQIRRREIGLMRFGIPQESMRKINIA